MVRSLRKINRPLWKELAMKIAPNLDTTAAFALSNKSSGNSQNSFQASLENALNAINTSPAASGSKTMTPADKLREAQAADAATLAEFREYMSKTPEQRMVEAILKELGITKEEFNALPPEERAAVETSIAAKIRERLEAQEQKKANELATKQANDGNAGLFQLLSL